MKGLMLPTLPQVCPTKAFSALKTALPYLETPEGLLEGAFAVSLLRNSCKPKSLPSLQVTLDNMADIVNRRVFSNNPMAFIAHLNDYLFEEMKFSYQPGPREPAEMHDVVGAIRCGVGTPTILAALYKLVASRLKTPLQVDGLGIPNQFMVAVQDRSNTAGMVLNLADGGRLMTVPELKQFVSEVSSDNEAWTDDFLQPVSHRVWISRMLQNVRSALCVMGLPPDKNPAPTLAVLEMSLLLWPDEVVLYRDMGLIMARANIKPAAAKLYLETYLQHRPNDPRAKDFQMLVGELGTM